jgi:hypothetical protein
MLRRFMMFLAVVQKGGPPRKRRAPSLEYYWKWHVPVRGSVTYFAVRRETTECRVLALSCRAGGADQCPKLGVERTQRRHAATAESNPKRSLGRIYWFENFRTRFGLASEREVGTDRAIKAWYHPSIA